MSVFPCDCCWTNIHVRTAMPCIGIRFAGEWSWMILKPGTANLVNNVEIGVNGTARAVIAVLTA